MNLCSSATGPRRAPGPGLAEKGKGSSAPAGPTQQADWAPFLSGEQEILIDLRTCEPGAPGWLSL